MMNGRILFQPVLALLGAFAMGSLLAADPPAPARPANPAPRELSLVECIEWALAHNFDLQIQRSSNAITHLELTGAYGAYDPVLRFHADRTYVSQPGFLDPRKSGSDSPYELTTDSFGAGFTGLLPTGLTYDLGANSDSLQASTDFRLDPKSSVLYPPLGIRDTNLLFFSTFLTLRQPLLKNMWTDAHRTEIRVTQKQIKISTFALKQRMQTVIANVETAYYDLYYAREKVKVDEASLALAEQVLSDTKKRSEAGEQAQLQVESALAEVESARADLLDSQQGLSERQNKLRNLLSDAASTWIDVPIVPRETLVADPVYADRETSWRYAMENRPEIIQSRLELEKQDIHIKYRRNQLYPTLDAVGSYGRRSAETAFGDAVGDVADNLHPSYSFGAILSFPLGNRTAKSDYRIAKTKRSMLELEHRKLEQTILLEVDDAVHEMDSALKQVAATTQARIYAEKAMAAEQKKLRMGLNTSQLVLVSQERLVSTRTKELRALADYKKAQSRLALAEGRTLERHHILLESRP